MKQLFKQIINDCFTEPNNHVYCLGRISLGVVLVTFVGGTITHLWAGHPFDWSSFGTGGAAMMAGGGALLYGKKDSSAE